MRMAYITREVAMKQFFYGVGQFLHTKPVSRAVSISYSSSDATARLARDHGVPNRLLKGCAIKEQDILSSEDAALSLVVKGES